MTDVEIIENIWAKWARQLNLPENASDRLSRLLLL